jgi:hypothetical protein
MQYICSTHPEANSSIALQLIDTRFQTIYRATPSESAKNGCFFIYRYDLPGATIFIDSCDSAVDSEYDADFVSIRHIYPSGYSIADLLLDQNKVLSGQPDELSALMSEWGLSGNSSTNAIH